MREVPVTRIRGAGGRAILGVAVLGAAMLALPATAGASGAAQKRYLVVAKSDADVAKLQAQVRRNGGTVATSLRRAGVLVVRGSAKTRAAMRASSAVNSVGRSRVVRIMPPDQAAKLGKQIARRLDAAGPVASAAAGFKPDPAFFLPGLQWDYRRINAPGAWKVTTGSSDVTVAVADTGLDYTHRELRPKVKRVVDFTSNLCKQFFGLSDREIAQELGVPANLDFNGHGSWIGGNIAAAANGVGTNGIAPGVKLVSLKISQWCGFANDAELLAAFMWAANHDVDVVNISFGGFGNRAAWRAYNRVINFAKSKGTAIVGAAGNEAVRVSTTGRVISHGQLAAPGEAIDDPFGTFELPAGVPAAISVSATGNVVAAPSQRCAPATMNTTIATCKPVSDRHDPIAVGSESQLAYYSNYGPGIDLAAPGGARKFNLPVWDRGGTPGFPWTTADGTKAFQTFSTTSNVAPATGAEVPCFTFVGGGFPRNQCYSTIQGTSMAAPHVVAAIALVASAHPEWRGNVDALVNRLKATAHMPNNHTPGLAYNDHSPGDLRSEYPDRCTTGWCHLGGAAISDRDAYGAGLINVGAAVQ
jgi:subtilisin family serine protease